MLLLSRCISVFADDATEKVERPLVSPAAEQTLWFEQHIRPLLISRCYECHSEERGERDGGLVLDSRMGWSSGGDSGPAIIPGDVEASELVRRIRSEDAEVRMPPKEPLTEDEIALLEQWVRQGAPDPRTVQSSVSAEDPHPSDPIAGRDHWAFRPLSVPAIPSVSNESWPLTDIDRFVLAGLDQVKLTPNPAADRRTLLRRICYLLTGLPPTEEQSAAFLTDDRPEAFEQLVDQLLASPHFGERWGRHWLDLARYADSNGLDENFLFREAWRYRNWVIDAVNADLPFNRFLEEQIAGDLLPYDTIEQRDRQRIATGFLLVGPKVLLGNDNQERVMDVADEQLNTIGRAVLGQTLGCARCHDHKFDPVPTADYYALAGIFTSTSVLEQRYMLGQQRIMEQLIGLGENGDQLDNDYEKYWREIGQLKERQQQAKKALELLQADDAAAFTAFAEKHSTSIAEGVRQAETPLPTRVEQQMALVAELDQQVANPPVIPPRAMIPTEVSTPADEFIRIAGRFNQKGDQVPRGFLRVFGDTPIRIPADQSGRLELARWLTDVDLGAGRVAARVQANRIWYHLLGRGIVRTVDNFGRTGETPANPELLEHLAGRLIASNWSLKSLIREIVLSRVFALSSEHHPQAAAVDPENVHLWRANRRRLAPEALRDSMLIAAGTMDFKPMESTVWYLGDQATAVGANTNRRRTDFPCRSVYL
ncbi:MAG: PSD1 domain-containing protein, partial [Planctomycetaceae bacterium]|nr:PSD1 domain-containing protein [Planctomycetaceae bacterium]